MDRRKQQFIKAYQNTAQQVQGVPLQRAQTTRGQGANQSAYREFKASELYCPNCKRAMPVREKLLLVLAGGDLYEYLCTGCGAALGSKKG